MKVTRTFLSETAQHLQL